MVSLPFFYTMALACTGA